MSNSSISRREMLAGIGVTLGTVLATGHTEAAKAQPSATPAKAVPPFRYCLNTGTIRGQKLGIVKEVEITAKAGYQAIEPWIQTIQDYTKKGGSLKDLRKRIDDVGITVESAIDFTQWIVDDDTKRTQALEQSKRSMDMLAQIGGKRIAAPPAGATKIPGLDLMKAADRYRALLEIGDELGVIPQVEVWGFSKNLHRLGQSMFVVIESGHPKACLLPDVYHIYKGGSNYEGLKQLSPKCIQVLHMNDYPNDPARGKIGDSDRVMPGDGVAPIRQILQDLAANHNRPVLSLELFSPKYWQMDALEAARIGLDKMKSVVQSANV
jgi:2-keto-myo-inositol isomerase